MKFRKDEKTYECAGLVVSIDAKVKKSAAAETSVRFVVCELHGERQILQYVQLITLLLLI